MKKICAIIFFILCHLNMSPAILKHYIDSNEITVEIESPKEFNLNLNLSTFDYSKYIEILGLLESNNNYLIINQFGYLGKYQFSRLTLKQLYLQNKITFDIHEIGSEKFLKSKKMQEEAVKALTYSNLKVITNYGLLEYRFRIIDGVFITNEGMLAACHLLGPYAVRQFLESGGQINKTDGNGTSVKDYLSKYQFIYN